MTFKVIQGQDQGQEMTSIPYLDYFLLIKSDITHCVPKIHLEECWMWMIANCLLPTALAREIMQSPLSVRPFPLLSFEPTDLWPWSLHACGSLPWLAWDWNWRSRSRCGRSSYILSILPWLPKVNACITRAVHYKSTRFVDCWSHFPFIARIDTQDTNLRSLIMLQKLPQILREKMGGHMLTVFAFACVTLQTRRDWLQW